MTTSSNPVRTALIDRRLTIGSWIQIGDPAIAEILSSSGYEWIAVDLEHGDISLEDFTSLARGMGTGGPVPFARVRQNDPADISGALDRGAMGVIVPRIESAEQARAAVQSARFPPIGRRGFGFARMNSYGRDFAAYAESANESVAVVVMIETRRGVENAGAILAVDGVDGVFIGPYDISGSYGVTGDMQAPVVREACATVVTACQEAGKAAGLHVVSPDQAAIQLAIDDGFTFIALGVDTVFLRTASDEALRIARELQA